MYTINHRVSGTTPEEKEIRILQTMKLLSLKDYSLTEFDDTLEDFIHNLIAVYNRKYPTIEVDKNIIENRPIVTKALKHRSLIDIFLLCKYYFPNCTLRECIKGLYSLDNTHICTQICSVIERRVYELKITQNSVWQNHWSNVDELGYTKQDYLNILNN